jgi:hypothetical protein
MALRSRCRTPSISQAGVASFQVPEAGRYSVAVDSRGSAEVVIARPVLSVFGAVLPRVGGAAAGGLCVLVGLLVLTLNHGRRPAAGIAADPP